MLAISNLHDGKFHSNAPYSFFLSKYTKDDLLFVSYIMSFDIKKSLRKDVFIKELSDIIERCPSVWGKRLPPYEIDLLQRVLDLPQGEGLKIYNNGRANILIAQLCLVLVHKGPAGSGEQTLFLSTESLRSVARSAIDCFQSIDDSTKREIEKLSITAEGLVNSVGPIELVKLVDAVFQRTRVPKDDFAYFNVLSSIKRLAVDIEDSVGYLTKYAIPAMVSSDNLDDVLDQCLPQTDIEPDFSSISDEQIQALGTRPYVRPINVQGEKVWKFFADRAGSGIADRLYAELWLKVQLDVPIGDVISWVSGKVKLASLEQTQEFMSLFIDFSNSIPKWVLKGHSSDEMAKKNEKPHMFPFAGMPFNFGPSQKPGRNDPCPCGSGKKYKHCCGK